MDLGPVFAGEKVDLGPLFSGSNFCVTAASGAGTDGGARGVAKSQPEPSENTNRGAGEATGRTAGITCRGRARKRSHGAACH